MTRDEALAAAERVLSLVNSQPRTPTREQVAEAIGYHHHPSHWPTVMACMQKLNRDLVEHRHRHLEGLSTAKQCLNAPSHINGPSALNASGMNGPFQGLSRLKPSELIQSEEF